MPLSDLVNICTVKLRWVLFTPLNPWFLFLFGIGDLHGHLDDLLLIFYKVL